jgi:hypothetical protein
MDKFVCVVFGLKSKNEKVFFSYDQKNMDFIYMKKLLTQSNII